MKTESGFIDLIVMIAVTAVLLVVLLPFGITAARLVAIKQTYAEAAYNLARRAVLVGSLPPTSELVDGYPTTVTTTGSLSGCSSLTVSLNATVTLSVLPVPGALAFTEPLHAAATVPTNAYLTPDSQGWDCSGS
jgi:hypothetical protein